MSNAILYIVKIGGNVVDNPAALQQFLTDFSTIKSPKILVHGGGKIATQVAEKLGIEVTMVNGRRITDAAMLDVAVMVYAGLANKSIVAQLQANQCNAIGLSGADANSITAHKRIHPEIDYGFVGDIDAVNTPLLQTLIDNELTPVVSAITHDGNGRLLNTNADTIAAALAVATADIYDVQLIYCFEKNGVLTNVDDENSVIPFINPPLFKELKSNGAISQGMLPKLDNAFNTLQSGVKKVIIGHSAQLLQLTQPTHHAGTLISK